MDSIPPQALGAVGAALIAGIISLISLIISKESKTSEFRQAWIDSLRAELSSMISHLDSIDIKKVNFGVDSSTNIELVKENIYGFTEAYAKIKLRLNPSEKSAKGIIESLEKIKKELEIIDKANFSTIRNEVTKILNIAQPFLKSEWKRVKSGEITYSATKATTFTFVIIMAAVFFYSVIFR